MRRSGTVHRDVVRRGPGIDGGRGSTSDAAPTSDVLAGVDLPAADEQTVALAAAAELAFVDTLREQAGIDDLVGPLADEAFAAIAASQTTTGEARLPEIAQALGIQLASASAHLAAAVPAPGANRPPPNEWTGSVTGHATYTITMMTGMLSGAIGRADVDQPRTTQTVEDHFDSTTGGVHEVVDIKTTYTLQTGGGRMFGEIKLETIAVGTDPATGTSIGTILGTATGSIDVNACPDETGLAEGRLTLALSEGITGGSGGGAGSSHAVDAPLRLIDGDDAHLVRTELDASVEAAGHGPGTAGGDPGAPFDWAMSGVVPLELGAGGDITIDRSGFTMTGRDATDADVAGAINHAVVGSVSIAREIGREAERFWRSGKCIDLKASEQSRAVEPDEQLTIDVAPVHRFDGQPVKAPVSAALQGTKSVEPANTPVDPPASFDFIAGHNPGEKGALTLTQTGRRGIGKATLDFEVKPVELALSIRSVTSYSPTQGVGSDGVITVAVTLKPGANGAFVGEGEWSLKGTFFFSAAAAVHESACKGALSSSGPIAFTATLDEADPSTVVLTWKGDVPGHVSSECHGEGAGSPLIFAQLLFKSFSASIDGVRLTVDGPPVRSTGRAPIPGGSAKTTTTVKRSTGALPGA